MGKKNRVSFSPNAIRTVKAMASMIDIGDEQGIFGYIANLGSKLQSWINDNKEVLKPAGYEPIVNSAGEEISADTYIDEVYADKLVFEVWSDTDGWLKIRMAYVTNENGDIEFSDPELVKAVTSFEKVEAAKVLIEEVAKKQPAKKAQASVKRMMKTYAMMQPIIVAEQTEDGEDENWKFDFILTHIGANANGDYFSPEELKEASDSIVGKKIDMQHDQAMLAIVGKVLSSEYVDDGENSHVTCGGELFTLELNAAHTAHILIANSVVQWVSMECDYEMGKCSICGNEAYHPDEFCMHMAYKGGQYKGEDVWNILHGISFTGVGLLDEEGADNRALIQAAADKQFMFRNGEKLMAIKKEEKQKKVVAAEEEEISEDATMEEELALMKQENESLKVQLEEALKTIEELQSQISASKREAEASVLLENYALIGKVYSGEALDKVIADLMAMEEDKFRIKFDTIAEMASEVNTETAEENEEEEVEIKAEASKKKGMTSQAKNSNFKKPEKKDTIEEVTALLIQGFNGK